MSEALDPSGKSAAPSAVVLYDGVCALCNWSVRVLVRADKHGALHFAPLQGETAGRLLERTPHLRDDLDTVVFVNGDRAHLRSSAFVHAARLLPYPWKALSWLWLVPAFIRNGAYRLIAALRYRVFGKYETCSVPPQEHRARFLP